MINLVASPTFPPDLMLQTLALSVTQSTNDIVLVFMYTKVYLSYRRMQYLYKRDVTAFFKITGVFDYKWKMCIATILSTTYIKCCCDCILFLL